MTSLRIAAVGNGFDIIVADLLIVSHRADRPAIFVGRGRADIAMYRGNFDIADRIDERIALRHAEVRGERIVLSAAPGQASLLTLAAAGDAMILEAADTSLNRFWMRTHAEPGERLWGAGEQMSYFDLAGRRFPLWTSEPGVGRDKTTALTFQADVTAHSGGDYWNTNYPQPT